jgi:hypothetical protein
MSGAPVNGPRGDGVVQRALTPQIWFSLQHQLPQSEAGWGAGRGQVAVGSCIHVGDFQGLAERVGSFADEGGHYGTYLERSTRLRLRV